MWQVGEQCRVARRYSTSGCSTRRRPRVRALIIRRTLDVIDHQPLDRPALHLELQSQMLRDGDISFSHRSLNRPRRTLRQRDIQWRHPPGRNFYLEIICPREPGLVDHQPSLALQKVLGGHVLGDIRHRHASPGKYPVSLVGSETAVTNPELAAVDRLLNVRLRTLHQREQLSLRGFHMTSERETLRQRLAQHHALLFYRRRSGGFRNYVVELCGNV